MPGPLDQLREAKKTLPPGHYGIKEAEKRVEKEYNLCEENEKRFLRSIKKKDRNITKQEADRFCLFLSSSFRLRKVKVVDGEIKNHLAGGEYHPDKREVHVEFWKDRTSLHILLHELAHYVHSEGRIEGEGNGMHKGNFIYAENLVFEAWKEFRRG